MSFFRALFVLCLGAAFASCWRGHHLGAVSPDTPKCENPADCPYGYECSAGACLASECNDSRPCAKGGCTYEDNESANKGWGVCD